MKYLGEEFYTIGELWKRKLLKRCDGQDYSDKSSISKVVNKMEYSTIPTAYGKAKCISQEQVDEHNRKCFEPGNCPGCNQPTNNAEGKLCNECLTVKVDN